MFEIFNNSELDLGPLEDLIQEFMPFAQERHGFQRPPKLFLLGDEENAANPLGKTGGYNPDSMEVTIYVSGRHPKDILRSFSHELVHHNQNERGDLSDVLSTALGYAQDDPHMRDMEREAYEQGNLCFRDWEDGRKKQLQESIYYETIIGGNDMSEKKPLKEWKDNEINTRLMEKFGLTKEGADSGEADSITIHDETTAEKRSGDEESDEEEDEEESIRGLEEKSANDTLSRLNEEVSHLLKEQWGGLPSLGQQWDALKAAPGKALDWTANTIWDAAPRSMRDYGESWSPWGASDAALGNTAGGTTLRGPTEKLPGMISPGEYERGTEEAKEEAAFSVADALMMGGELSALRGAAGAPLRRSVAREYRGTDLENIPGAGKRYMETDTVWNRPDSAIRPGNTQPSVIYSPPKSPVSQIPVTTGGLTTAQAARRFEIWRASQRAADEVATGARTTRQQPALADDVFGHDWTHDFVDPNLELMRQPAPDPGALARLKARWQNRRGRGATDAVDDLATPQPADDLITPRGMRADEGFGVHMDELTRLYPDHVDAVYANPELFARHLYDQIVTGRGGPTAAFTRAAGHPVAGLMPGRARSHLRDPRIANEPIPVSGGKWRVNSDGMLVPRFLNPSARGRYVAGGLGAGAGAAAIDQGYFPPDPRIGLPGSPTPWNPEASIDDPGLIYDMPYQDRFFSVEGIGDAQPLAYTVRDEEGRVFARNFGDPEVSAERWKAWTENPNIKIISDVYGRFESPPPQKRDDLGERAPYVWEELNESLDLDEDFYDTLFEGVEDMWAKEIKE